MLAQRKWWGEGTGWKDASRCYWLAGWLVVRVRWMMVIYVGTEQLVKINTFLREKVIFSASLFLLPLYYRLSLNFRVRKSIKMMWLCVSVISINSIAHLLVFGAISDLLFFILYNYNYYYFSSFYIYLFLTSSFISKIKISNY